MTTPFTQGSRWSSLLQQAVAGVENRLDNILADGNEEALTPRTAKKSAAPPSGTSVKPEFSVSRNAPTNNRTNDRLQERLARAIANRNAGPRGELPSSGVPPRSSSSVALAGSPRTSLDANLTESVEKNPDPDSVSNRASLTEDYETEASSITLQNASPIAFHNEERKTSGESTRSSAPGQPARSVPNSATSLLVKVKALSNIPTEYEDFVKNLQLGIISAESQRQKETFDYIEKIDTLESKLQYLAKESAQSARITGAAAPSGSLEKKLADKELQVALLLSEGQSLSKKELDYLATIKKLRAKIHEDGKEIAAAKKDQEDAKKDAAISTERWKKIQIIQKQLDEKQRIIAKLQQNIKLLQSEIQTKTCTIIDLKARLEEAIRQEDKENSKLMSESLEVEKKRVAFLEAEVSRLESEKKIVAVKTQNEIQELKETMSKNEERARIASLEMMAEQQMLEGKLEIMRARTEEVSSGALGDAQTKLFRQIETLQTQYSVANDNWQGIEASLTSRTLNLEKERDEAIRREADVRRKAREANLKAKVREEELEVLRTGFSASQRELSECKAKLEILARQTKAAESLLLEAQTAYDHDKKAWELDMKHRLEEERQRWHEEVSSSNSVVCNPIDPTLTSTKFPTSEYTGLQNSQSRRTSARSLMTNESSPISYVNRRAPTQVFPRASVFNTVNRQDSIVSLKEEVEEDPPHIDPDFENGIMSSPYQTMSDITSVPNEDAGPSVQLVERMSSAVRRLECEKVATKEDLVRLSKLRDEARAEIVSLMRELEVKKEIEKKLEEMNMEMNDMKKRYETALVMLGEKSEEVEELRGDIEDIKCMYRELVEKTVK